MFTHQMKHCLAAIVALLCSITMSAHDFEVDGIYYNITSSTDKTVEVTYRGSASDSYSDEYSYHETIPSTVTYGGITYIVTAIGEWAFLSCKKVTGVTLPNTITNINERAFYYCTNLSDITLPTSVKTIGGSAFGHCESLTSITIPENVTTIREGAFDCCTNLTNYIFNATNMTSAAGESENGQYISSLFYACNKLTTITIGANVKKIPAYAFWQCNKVTKITIPENVTSIGDEAFGMCSSLKEVVFNAKNCTSAGGPDYPSFNNCNNLTTIKIGENVKGIPSYVFCGCTKITSITIPNSVTGLGYGVFRGCTGLKNITLPNSITYIPNGLFNGCTSLSSITIPNSVTLISWGAFLNCSALTNIIIPNSVKRIEHGAFDGCVSLTDIEIPESITRLEQSVFKGCTNLVNINIPESVTEIQGYAFSDCISLTNISMPTSVTTIGLSAFSGCTSLTSVTIPNSVTKIESRAFYGCTSLTNISLPNTITNLGDVFRGCTSLKNITIPNSVTSLGYTFYDCTSLTDIVIPNSVTTIGECTFRGCTNLKSVTIPNSVTNIEWAAFASCTSLTSITIPESVKVIESDAFNSCRVLTEVICKSKKPITISSTEFHLVSTTATLYVPKGSKDAYASATGWSKFKNVVEFSLIPEYTITYMVDGNVYYSETIERDAEIPAIDAPIKEGYTFNGWENIPSTMPDEDITVYAIYTPNNYTVTFKANDEVVSSESLAYGTTIVAPNAPEVEDYAFVEWTGLLETVPARNVEFVAEYVQIGIHIVDGVTSSYIQNEDVEFSRIRYTRNFKNTNWQALYVPFEIPYENIKDDFAVAYINDVHQFDDDDDGTIDRTRVEAIKVTGGVLKANYPYMIRAKVAGEKTITVTDATLYAAEENSIDCSSVFDTYTFTGTYSKIPAAELPKEEGYYALSGGSWKQFSSGATSNLGAFRIYMKIDSRHANATVEARAIEMRVIGDDEEETTGVENMVLMVNGQQSTLIYDLQGRRVEHPTKGLYIVNGEKVWIK